MKPGTSRAPCAGRRRPRRRRRTPSAARAAQVGHHQPGRRRLTGRPAADRAPDRLRAHHDVGQLADRPGADLLGQVACRPAAAPARSPPTASATGCLLTTRSKDSAGNGRSASSATVGHRAAERGQVARASSAFGGQDSVAASTRRRAAGSAPAPPRRRSGCRAPPSRPPSAAPAAGRTPTAGVPRWPGPRTRRSPSRRPARSPSASSSSKVGIGLLSQLSGLTPYRGTAATLPAWLA